VAVQLPWCRPSLAREQKQSCGSAQWVHMIRDSSSLMSDEGRRGVGSDSRLIPTRHRDRVERGDRHEQAVAIASIIGQARDTSESKSRTMSSQRTLRVRALAVSSPALCDSAGACSLVRSYTQDGSRSSIRAGFWSEFLSIGDTAQDAERRHSSMGPPEWR
jgi:hypothetical protein